MEAQYYVRRGPTLQYGPKVPEDILDMDQVFSLRGEKNDERLVRLGFVAVVSPRAVVVQCGQCGAKFINEGALEQHGRRRHDAKRNTDEVVSEAVRASNAQIVRDLEQKAVVDVTGTVGESEDRKIDRVVNRMDAERPILWENTEAAKRAGDAPVVEVSTAPAKSTKARKRPTVRKETP